tara:strand:- start:103 stop:360 length:258 start_codon:yes stop_codon:yes gene_type:complete
MDIMNIIKKYTGLIGFIIAFPFIFIAAYYKYYYNNEYELLGYLAIFLWITTMTLQHELNKEKPKKWFISLVIVTFFIAVFFFIFN